MRVGECEGTEGDRERETDRKTAVVRSNECELGGMKGQRETERERQRERERQKDCCCEK